MTATAVEETAAYSIESEMQAIAHEIDGLNKEYDKANKVCEALDWTLFKLIERYERLF